MRAPNPIRKFFEGPASVRNAIRAIVAATVTTTVVAGLLVYTFDPDSFDNPGDALWWALQTITTVGYGDVTPNNGVGRIIGGVVLVYTVAFMSILTAAITTSFVAHARRQRDPADEAAERGVQDRLDDIASRLDRIERQLADAAAPGGAPDGSPTVTPGSPPRS